MKFCGLFIDGGVMSSFIYELKHVLDSVQGYIDQF